MVVKKAEKMNENNDRGFNKSVINWENFILEKTLPNLYKIRKFIK